MPIPDELRELAIGKVLVVDDEQRFLSSIERAFRPYAAEFRIYSTDNGIDALMLIGSVKPEVVVLDIRMHGLNGFDVMERLRANPAMRHTVVIAVSGQMDEATEQRCRQLGAARCLQKPLKVLDLLETLRELRKPRATWSR